MTTPCIECESTMGHLHYCTVGIEEQATITAPTAPEVKISTSPKTGNLVAYVPSGLYIATVDSLNDLPSLTQAVTRLRWTWDGEYDAEEHIQEWMDLVRGNPLGAIALRIAASEWGI